MTYEKDMRRVAIGLTIAGALARLAPHPQNFAPVGAMSLFAGARLRGWQAFLLPLVLMAATDPIVGGYSVVTPVVYASFMLSVWIGRWLRPTESFGRIGAACLLGSIQFFVFTNLAVWAVGMYPRTWAGLVLCYANAIPYFGRTLAGDLLYSAALFGLHAWLSRMLGSRERVAAAS